jgi:hypothetical protein
VDDPGRIMKHSDRHVKNGSRRCGWTSPLPLVRRRLPGAD